MNRAVLSVRNNFGDINYNEAASKNKARWIEELERKFGLPPGTVKCFEFDPSKPVGIIVSLQYNNKNYLDLWVIQFLKPQSQSSQLGVCRGDTIYQIGSSRLTIRDDFKATAEAEQRQALLNNSTYKLITFPGAKVLEAAREHCLRKCFAEPSIIDIEIDNREEVHSPVDFEVECIQEGRLKKRSIEPSTVNNGANIEKIYGATPTETPPDAIIPTSLGDGTRSVRFKHIHNTCRERIQQIQKTYFLWNPKKGTSDTSALPNFEGAIKHVIDALAAEETTQFDRTKRFRGLQPWMLTRKYVVHKVAAWHQWNGSLWMKSMERLNLFKKHYLPSIETYLATWILTEHQQDLHEQAQLIWDHIVKVHISACDDGRDWFLQYKITERRIIDMAERLCKAQTLVLHSIFPVSIDGPCESVKKLERKLAKVIQTIQYEVLPFSEDIEDVVETLKHHFWDFWVNPVNHLADVNDAWLRYALDDVEDEGSVLSYHNQLFRVSIKLPDSCRIAPNGRSDISNMICMGSRVFASDTTKEQFSWGYVSKLSMTNKVLHYSVDFDGGYTLHNLPANKIYTEAEYKETFGILPQPTPKQNEELSTVSRNLPLSRQNSELSAAAPVDTFPNSLESSTEWNANHFTQAAKISSSMTLEELYKQRCGHCTLCKRRDCGHCFTCLSNIKKKNLDSKEVCLRKMCCRFSPKNKAQPAPGFPLGYTFFFEDPKQKARFRGSLFPETVSGLKFITPGGQTRFLDSVRRNKEITKEVLDSFLSFVGVVRNDSQNHSFLDKNYRHQWTDVFGKNKVVFGKVVACSTDWSDGCKNEIFTVEFSDDSCRFAEEASSNATKIKRTQEVFMRPTLGGIASYDNYVRERSCSRDFINSDYVNGPMMCWVTPEMRSHTVDAQTGLPRLNLLFRGWKFEFSVKPSTIENAGFGCFLRCTHLFGEDNHVGSSSFALLPGELLDLGVYAPFRDEDKKSECIFKLKNYIHSLSPEEWVFGSPDGKLEYDITEEATGEPHCLAMQHIYMYVNETHDPFPTIHALYDPEGYVHYLFGIEFDGDKDTYREAMNKLSKKNQQGEFEVFAFYGEEYETVRIRKGYSIEENIEQVGDEEKDEDGSVEEDEDFISEIKKIQLKDICMVLSYLSGPFFTNASGSSVGAISIHVKRRILKVLSAIKLRIDLLLYSYPLQDNELLLKEQGQLLTALREKVIKISEL